MIDDSDSLARIARAICEQALYERHNVSPDAAEVDRRSPGFLRQAPAAILAYRGDLAALESQRRVRTVWDELLAAPPPDESARRRA